MTTCPHCAAKNPATMRFCGMCGGALGARAAPPRRERRRVTTVFFDLAGFSTLTRDFDPEKLRDLADDILTMVAGIIEEYDGYVDAFQGDGLIALFGAPHSHPNDPERAVLAAAEGLQAVEAIGRSKGYPLKGRAGVNTGVVIAGNLGSGSVKSYTVMGSAVNLAARLEAAATPGEVWVGPETYRATRHALRYLPSPVLSLPGFPDITQAQRLVREVRVRDPHAHLSFVGRSEELAALRRALQGASERKGAREVWVVGEAGLGKTRLVREFAREVSGQQLARVLWLEPGDGGRVSTLPGATPDPAGGFEVLRELDRAGQPLVLVLEQTPQSATLEPLVAALREAPVGLLLVRLSRRPPAAPAPGAQLLALAPLSTDDCLRILGELVDPSLKLATTALVHEAGGSPAYTIELGRTLSSAGSGAFSGSLTSLLQARLDMLPAAQRYLLAQLALCGERTWLSLAAQLAEGARADLGALLSQDFLRQEPDSSLPGEVELRFRSELLRRAALLMVPFGERPALHRQVAAWLAARPAPELAALYEHHRLESARGMLSASDV